MVAMGPDRGLRRTAFNVRYLPCKFAVGMYSYSIYLWHVMVSQHIQGAVRLVWSEAGETAVFWSYVLVSLGVGIALSKMIEFPVLHLRDRLFPARQRKGAK